MPAIGILFRRVATKAERRRARRLVEAAGLAIAPGRNAAWYGLWDLGAAEGADLLGVAATHTSAAGVVELDVLVVPAAARRRGYGRRLLAEVINRVRAEGAQRLVSRVPADSGAQALLVAAGFRADEAGQDPDVFAAWWSLEL
jgi:GNAT superfamily N-acetyltransferase